MKSDSIFPVILCGGSGSRLWPLSRQSYPKQFLSINSKNSDSLLQQTQKRISDLDNLKQPIIICNEEHRFIVAEQMRGININPHSIILEPFGKNTCPAIVLAALEAIKTEVDPTLLVLSSDHEIKEEKKFLDVIQYGLNFTSKNRLITFGIIPSSPETGYGYIKSEKPFTNETFQGHQISEFTEKPNLRKAQEFLKDKRYSWNSGIFMFKAKAILNEVKKFSPEIIEFCNKSLISSKKDLDFTRIDNKFFKKCPNISIDIAVLEKTQLGTVIPLDVGWSDIGSWESVWESANKDENKNYKKGNVFLKESKNSYIRSESRLLTGIGLKNLIVIETSDAILIADKKYSQKVKEIVEELKSNKIPEAEKHRKIYRPWGSYVSLVEDDDWQVKLIDVSPGGTLSLQMHHHRSEHWIVVSGTARVEINESISILCQNESTYIPQGSKHRLMNPGKIPLRLIEVQSGSYLGEDDIIRFEDVYGRSE